MSEYPHNERNDHETYAPPDTLSDNLDDDELDEFAMLDEEEPDDHLDALDEEWDEAIPATNGSGSERKDHRTTRVRRAIERHRERVALRAMLADGFADSWDEFDTEGTGH